MDSERSSKEKFDVIIVGGGPAGLKCAHTLANSGMSVLLLEKEPVFGNKICAGGLTANDLDPKLEIHLDSRLFKSWYAWIFPHENSVAVGCCSNPKILPPARLRDNFHQWLDRKNIDYTGMKLETYPISYDYRGVRFGNIYRIGEAAGMASGLTG